MRLGYQLAKNSQLQQGRNPYWSFDSPEVIRNVAKERQAAARRQQRSVSKFEATEEWNLMKADLDEGVGPNEAQQVLMSAEIWNPKSPYGRPLPQEALVGSQAALRRSGLPAKRRGPHNRRAETHTVDLGCSCPPQQQSPTALA